MLLARATVASVEPLSRGSNRRVLAAIRCGGVKILITAHNSSGSRRVAGLKTDSKLLILLLLQALLAALAHHQAA